jgi:hypothetical protein
MQLYNFGDPGLSGSPVANDYTAHWANNVPEPASVVMLAVSIVTLIVLVQMRRGHNAQVAI